MRRFKFLLFAIVVVFLSGCDLNTEKIEDFKITTSIYPIEYIVKKLYGDHSEVYSIYPKETEISNFEITDTLLDQYSNNNLLIFNGLSNENKHINYLLSKNKKLKIIDATSNIQYDYSIEELWLDPSNLLAIANNIRNGFKEYINSTYLVNEINNNYENIKISLSTLDGKYYETLKQAKYNTIIVSDDAFKFLEKYGIKVISLDLDTVKEKTTIEAVDAIKSGKCKYIFTKYKENNEDIDKFVEDNKISKIELYTMTNLESLNVEKNDYVILMYQNLESLKQELYK